MTLNDFINYICLQVNRVDNDSRLACATFVDARYGMIYDAYPWRDTELVSVTNLPAPNLTSGGPAHKPFLQSTYLPFPPNTDRIVKVGLITVAGGLRAITDLRPTDSASLLESRPDVILEYGVPQFYEEVNDANGRFIQIYPPVVGPDWEFLVVGKKVRNRLINSNDTPTLRNIDNALIALGIADMLKRDRHYAKAQQQLTEAQAILQEAIDLEQKQSNAPRAARPLSITGGTLTELTDAVSSRLGLWDIASQNKIIESLRRNYQSLYDSELWTESIVILSMQAQGQQLILPDYIDKVMVVNDQSNATIDVVELEYQFRVNPSLFDADGSPTVFSMMPPVAVRVLPETEEQLSFISDNPSDAFNVSVVGSGNGLEMTEVVSVTNGTGITANSYLYPYIISKEQSLGKMTIAGGTSLVKLGEIPANQSSVQHQRVWIQPTDSGSFNGYYFVLGKRRLQQLIAPTDAIAISGCESALIAMACADVGPTDQVARFQAEADKEEQALVALQTNQQTRRTTITPYTDRNDEADADFWLRG